MSSQADTIAIWRDRAEPDAQAATTPPPKRRRLQPSRRTVLSGLIATVGLVVLLAAIPLAVPFPWCLVAHYECGPGTVVATTDLWTPWVLVNAPYGGYANGSGSLLAGSGRLGTTVALGGAAGMFQRAEWTVTTSIRVLVAGPGANADCAGFLATPRFVGEYLGAVPLQPQNVTSDARENVSIRTAGYDSVLVDNGYSEADRSVSTCGGGKGILGVTASRETVQVPFPLDGSSHSASATLDGSFNYTYSFPGGFGTWSIDDLNVGSHAPGGGWAFSFTPCS